MVKNSDWSAEDLCSYNIGNDKYPMIVVRVTPGSVTAVNAAWIDSDMTWSAAGAKTFTLRANGHWIEKGSVTGRLEKR